MISLEKKQTVLLSIAPILCISMLILIPLLTVAIGRTAGYVVGFCIYWFIFCLPVSVYNSNGLSSLGGIYTQKSNIPTIMRKLYYLLAFIPCIATFFVVFKELASTAGLQIFLLLQGLFFKTGSNNFSLHHY